MHAALSFIHAKKYEQNFARTFLRILSEKSAIKQAFEQSLTKPEFVISENSITVVLPLLKEDRGLTGDQQLVYDLLGPARLMSAGELERHMSFSRSKLTGILKQLISLGLVETSGVGRGLKYRRVA